MKPILKDEVKRFDLILSYLEAGGDASVPFCSEFFRSHEMEISKFKEFIKKYGRDLTIVFLRSKDMYDV